jgi:PPOX class probable F420-dependent enzyme
MIEWPAAARAFVGSARVAHLATADRDANPHVVPICFALVDERLYSVVDDKPKRNARSLKRLRNIAANPSVAVIVDRWDEDWSRLAWVRIQGRAAVVADGAEYAAAIAQLRAKYEQYRDARFAPASHPLIRVAIERVVAWQGSAR